MSELDKVLNEAIAERDHGPLLKINSLIEMINEAISLREDAPVKVAGSQTLTLKLPKIEISEKWGQREVGDNDARRQFRLYMKNLRGDSIQEKLAHIKQF